MKIIGLTGGIGSGKSTVAHMFESFGVPVYYADQEAKDLMINSEPLRAEIKKLFGEKAYINKALNRIYIADIVFRDKDKLKALNKVVHPTVKKHFQDWVKSQISPYVLQENALIFEKKEKNLFDKVILVVADENIRVKRVIDRDQLNREQVLDRVSNQLKDREKIKDADFVIYNDSLAETKIQVDKIHKELTI